MMACGCPVIELNSESNKVTFPNSEIIELTDSHPIAIADSIEKLLFDEKKRKSQVQKAYEFIKPLTWENSAKNLDELLRKNLTS